MSRLNASVKRFRKWCAAPAIEEKIDPQEAVTETPRGMLVREYRITIRRMIKLEFAEDQLHRIIEQEFKDRIPY